MVYLLWVQSLIDQWATFATAVLYVILCYLDCVILWSKKKNYGMSAVTDLFYLCQCCLSVIC